jgi:hypothetical protein
MILKIFSPKNLAKILAFFCSNYYYFLQKFDHNIGFREKAIFCRKLAKNATNYDHNIDPRARHKNSTGNFNYYLLDCVNMYPKTYKN